MSSITLIERLKQHTGMEKDYNLAIRCGISPSIITKLRQGLRAAVTLPVLKTMADSVDLPIGILADWWAEPDPDHTKTLEHAEAMRSAVKARKKYRPTSPWDIPGRPPGANP